MARLLNFLVLFLNSGVFCKIQNPCPTYTSSDPCDADEIKFFMGGVQIFFDFETETIGESNYDGNLGLALILHGADQDHDVSDIDDIRLAIEDLNEVNVISASYRRLTTGRYCFDEANFNLDYIGMCIAKFLNVLKPKEMHGIGFSLGGILLAFIDEHLQFKMTRATCLEPAGGPWGEEFYSLAITPNISEYTDVIWTSGNKFKYNLGHSDWHINDGIDPQPGCPQKSTIPLAEICSHSIVMLYYKESIENKNSFFGVMCDSEVKNCAVEGPFYRMGYHVDTDTFGVLTLDTLSWTVDTNENFPFGMGIPVA